MAWVKRGTIADTEAAPVVAGDLPDTPGSPVTAAAGFVHLNGYANEGGGTPSLVLSNSEGTWTSLISAQDLIDLGMVVAGDIGGAGHGGLLVGDAAFASFIALPPGADGQILSVDSTEPAGLKWVDP